MSTQYISRTVPIRYSGYATCDRCAETFYPEQPGQTTCKLCRTEQAFRGYGELSPKPCEQCGVIFTPRDTRARYHNYKCKLRAMDEKRRQRMGYKAREGA